MNDKEKRAFVKKMKKAKEAKAKERKKTGGKSKKNWKNPIRKKIDPKNLKKVKSDIRSYQKSNAQRFPEDNWFKEYKRLGGKKNRKAYDKNLDVFVHHTNDIFIHGEMSKYNSRQEALEAVKKDLKIDNKELNLIFESIDNVTAYT